MATLSTQYIVFPVFGGAIGFILGSSTGLAFGGDAVNGGIIFGLIGAVIGFLVASSKFATNVQPIPDEQTEGHSGTPSDSNNPRMSNTDDNARNLAESAYTLFETAVNMAGSLWNLEMQLVKKTGAMPYFVRSPWLFLVIACLLLAVALPIGTLFVLTGFAALHFDISPENMFVVEVPKKDSSAA